MATNGHPDISSTGAASNGQPPSGTTPYRSAPLLLGPTPPLVPGPYRPPSAPPPGPGGSAPRASYSSCQQCPIHVAKINELQAKVRAQNEDAGELRAYIAREMEAGVLLKQTIARHEEHIDNREYELENAR
eukprot:1765286-Heterocapsa_arctica.AAC.1